MRTDRRRVILQAISLALIASTLPCHAGSRAPERPPSVADAWRPYHDPELVVSRRIDSLCRLDGQLLATGTWRSGERILDPRTTPAIHTWRDSCWVPLGGPIGHGHLLTANAHDLALTIGKQVHWRRDGRWQALTPVAGGTIRALILWRGRPVIGGSFLLPGQDGYRRIATWNDDRWQPLGEGVSGSLAPEVLALCEVGGWLWVGGRFAEAGGVAAANLAGWDGRFWSAVGGGTDGEVVDLIAQGGGLVAAGMFRRAGGVPCQGLARWQQGAWEALPDLPVPPPPDDPGVCPLPIVASLATLGDELVIQGQFQFDDIHGRHARSLARLSDGAWLALPESDAHRTPVSAGIIHSDGIFYVKAPDLTPRPYEVRRRSWRSWQLGAVASADDGLDVAASLSDRKAGVVAWRAGRSELLIPPGVRDGRGVRWLDSPLGPLIVGPLHLDNTVIAGLARRAAGRWQPIADWLGPDSEGGGRVDDVAEWRGDLVVAGKFDRAGQHVVRHVARLREGRWVPLGEGIPHPEIRDAVLAAGDDRLVLFCGVGLSANVDAPCYATTWLFVGDRWRQVPLPPETGYARDHWSVSAVGDTLWAVTNRWPPGERRAGPRDGFGLYTLADTAWTQVGAWDAPGIDHLVHWRGHTYGLADHWRQDVQRLVCWEDDHWHEVDPRALAPRAGLLVAGDRLLVTGPEYSLAWDGANWATWPGSGEQGELSWAGGRLRTSAGHLAVWEDPLPPDPPWPLPAPPPIRSWREAAEHRIDGMPALLGGDAEPTASWILRAASGRGPVAEVSPRGSSGVRLHATEDHGGFGLVYGFPTEAWTWYRFTCRGDASLWRSPSLSIGTNEMHAFTASWKRGHLQALVPAGEQARSGKLVFPFAREQMDFQRLALRSEPDALASELAAIWNEVLRRWRPALGDLSGGEAFPEELRREALATFDVAGADSLLDRMLRRFGDVRIAAHPWYRRPDGFDHWDRPRAPDRYPAPVDSLPCEALPLGIHRLLPGEVGYLAPTRRLRSSRTSSFGVPMSGFTGRGIVIDLRSGERGLVVPGVADSRLHDHLSCNDHGCRVLGERPGSLLDFLSRIGFPERRWARQRHSSGRRSAWFEVEQQGDAPGCPIIVWISRDTAGDAVLLAEALSRWDKVVLVGEPTAPVPAITELFAVPWHDADHAVAVPGGSWEDPDGHDMTQRTVAPEIVWPAEDTAGLLARSRDVFSAQK